MHSTAAGKVVLLNTTASGAVPARWYLGDLYYLNVNPNSDPFYYGARDVLSLWLKSENSGLNFFIEVHVYTTAGYKTLRFYPTP